LYGYHLAARALADLYRRSHGSRGRSAARHRLAVDLVPHAQFKRQIVDYPGTVEIGKIREQSGGEHCLAERVHVNVVHLVAEDHAVRVAYIHGGHAVFLSSEVKFFAHNFPSGFYRHERRIEFSPAELYRNGACHSVERDDFKMFYRPADLCAYIFGV